MGKLVHTTLGLFTVAFVLFGSARAVAKDKFAVVKAPPQVGQKVRLQRTMRDTTSLLFRGQGLINQVAYWTVEYTDEILEVDGKVVTRRQLTFHKCRKFWERIQGDDVRQRWEILPLEGKKVIITTQIFHFTTRSGTKSLIKKYQYTTGDGENLTGPSLAMVEDQMKRERNRNHLLDLLLPKIKVEKGDKWRLPLSKLLKTLEIPLSTVEQNQSFGSMRLEQLYSVGKSLMGHFSGSLYLRLNSSPEYTWVNPRGEVEVKFKLDLAINGLENRMRLWSWTETQLKGDVPTPQKKPDRLIALYLRNNRVYLDQTTPIKQ